MFGFNEEKMLQQAKSDIENYKYKSAVKKLEKLIAKDNGEAFYLMGDIYSSFSEYRDFEKGLQYYEKAADKGVVAASRIAGHIYEDGKGNPAEAAKYYQLGADNNDTMCINGLGRLAANFDGETHDYAKAFKYFQDSYQLAKGEQKDIAGNSAYMLGIIYWNGYITSADYKLAVDWFEKAGELEYKEAYYYLGQAYRYGKGKEKNSEKALECYQIAKPYVLRAVFELAKYYDELNDHKSAVTEFKQVENETVWFKELSNEYKQMRIQTLCWLTRNFRIDDVPTSCNDGKFVYR